MSGCATWRWCPHRRRPRWDRRRRLFRHFAITPVYVSMLRGLWVSNVRPRCLTCGFASESGGRRCRRQRAACSTGERHAGARSASCVDNRSVPEVMGFREAEVVPARPGLLSVVQPARLVAASRGGKVPC